MLTKDFYTIIDSELGNLLEKYDDDEFIRRHKKGSPQQKSYALLIWFLEFYGKKLSYSEFITDGKDDSSCDIVFDIVNNQKEKIFYIVQSKWNNAENSETKTDRDEILKTLSEFETILRGQKKHVNEKLEAKLRLLEKHRQENGAIKFIFLTLSQYDNAANDNIDAFLSIDEKTKFEVIDIDRIKSDYIDREYKKITPVNPLEYNHNPEEESVNIEIVQSNGKIKIEKPFEAYVFLLRPKSIFNLFEKYGFLLFHKNVRNPLLESQFNEEIEQTALDNPAYFWYYNNGITAITYSLPTIGDKAQKIGLIGFQIINGAQTVYSVYRAYKSASKAKRRAMDNEIFITLRLLKSGGKSFDLNVTKYTNSQNPVEDRDFYANDNIQVMLQNTSYLTNIWYEKRRGEFRETPENVRRIPNSVFANVYLAYHLQDPVSVVKNYIFRLTNNGKNLNFISHKEHKDGLYEKIFNEKTIFEDMLCAFYIFDFLIYKERIPYEKTFQTWIYHLLALFKVVFSKYLKAKFKSDKLNVNKHIIDIYKNDTKNDRRNDRRNNSGSKNKDNILKTFEFISKFIDKELEIENNKPVNKTNNKMRKFLLESSHYERVRDSLEELDISVNDIEEITLENETSIIDGDNIESSFEINE